MDRATPRLVVTLAICGAFGGTTRRLMAERGTAAAAARRIAGGLHIGSSKTAVPIVYPMG